MPRVDSQTVLNDARPVQRVRVVAQTAGPVGPNTSNNHWSIFFLISNTKSVRSNMTVRQYGDINGELQWEQQDYILTNSAIDHWDFSVASSFRACDIASLFYALNRHEYDMAPGGSGCRWWW
jgi:hypothetical protein